MLTMIGFCFQVFEILVYEVSIWKFVHTFVYHDNMCHDLAAMNNRTKTIIYKTFNYNYTTSIYTHRSNAISVKCLL